MNPKQIAEQYIEQAAADLDLADADDRATFRTRLADDLHMTRVHFIVKMAEALGGEIVGPVTRDKAVRVIARVAIERAQDEMTIRAELQISGQLARMLRGETAEIAGQTVERLDSGAFRVGEYVSPPVSRTRPAGAAVQATTRHLVRL